MSLLFALATACVCIGDASAQSTQDYVQFKIAPVSTSQKSTEEMAWQASYGADEKFIISLRLGHPSPKEMFTFSKGSISHVAGSNSREFLKKLAVALGAKEVPRPTKRVKTLTFDTAILGTNQTRIEGGGFSGRPAGNWITTKIFLAGGNGEVYLDIDPVSGVGEFSLKDEEYGNIVLRELASVL